MRTSYIFYLLSKIVPGIIGLVSIAFYARSLGANGYGEYSLTLALVFFFNGVLVQSYLNSVARNYYVLVGPDKTYGASELLVSFSIIAVLGSCSNLLIFLYRGISLDLVLLVVLYGFSQALYDFCLRLANLEFNSRLYAVMSILKSIVCFGFAYVFLKFNSSPNSLFLGLSLGLLTSSLLSLKYWKSCVWGSPCLKSIITYYRYATPFVGMLALNYVIDYSGRFFLGHYSGLHVLGAYASMYEITQQSAGVLLNIVHLVFYPLVIKAHSEGRASELMIQLQRAALLLLLISVGLLLGAVTLGPDFASRILGEELAQEGGKIIPLVTLSTILVCFKAFYFDYSYYLSNKMWHLLYIAGAVALINILLNYFLIPNHGAVGAAWSTVIAYFSALALTWALGMMQFKLPAFIFPAWKVFLALGAALAFIFYSDFEGVAAIAISFFMACFIFVIVLLVLQPTALSFLKDNR